MSGSNNTAAARNARWAQREGTREQQEQRDMESREDPEIISVVDNVEAEVQAPTTEGSQLKVLVHNAEGERDVCSRVHCGRDQADRGEQR